MSQAIVNGNSLGGPLQQMLTATEIAPGDEPSYQLCKVIYTNHPLGAKIVEKPLTLAQSQAREVSIPDAPEEAVEAFLLEWENIEADKHLFNLHRLARIYGIASMALLVDKIATDVPLEWFKIAGAKIALNTFDPLNTAGSLVINQNPNSLDFLKTNNAIRVSGSTYHGSRVCVVMNEDPLYIDYTNSAFGFVGRSVYQRALYPLKSFIQTMRTDDLVAVKAGVFVMMLKQAGSIADNMMAKLFGFKRQVVNEAQVTNTISIGIDEKIETLNMQNLDGAFGMARRNILENIAAAADDMPAKLLTSETFAEGFGEGTEDAKMVGRYVDRVRTRMNPSYRYMDGIVQYRAWNPEWYASIQSKYPELKRKSFQTAFYEWRKNFKAAWPNYLTEPPSEMVKSDEVKLKAVIAAIQVLVPILDPENKACLVQWAQDNINENKMMFTAPLELDAEAIKDYTPPEEEAMLADTEPKAAHPFSAQDSASVERAIRDLEASVAAYVAAKARPRPALVRAQ